MMAKAKITRMFPSGASSILEVEDGELVTQLVEKISDVFVNGEPATPDTELHEGDRLPRQRVLRVTSTTSRLQRMFPFLVFFNFFL